MKRWESMKLLNEAETIQKWRPIQQPSTKYRVNSDAKIEEVTSAMP